MDKYCELSSNLVTPIQEAHIKERPYRSIIYFPRYIVPSRVDGCARKRRMRYTYLRKVS